MLLQIIHWILRTHTLDLLQLRPTLLPPKLPTLPNITNIKHPRLLNSIFLQRLLQQPRWLHNLLIRQNPRPPMNTHGLPTLCILKDMHTIHRIGVHRRHDEAWIVCADGYKTEVEGAAEGADLFEGGAGGEVGVFFAIVVFGFWKFGDGAVACVAAACVSLWGF